MLLFQTGIQVNKSHS